jgi:hypothetical protein
MTLENAGAFVMLSGPTGVMMLMMVVLGTMFKQLQPEESWLAAQAESAGSLILFRALRLAPRVNSSSA